MKISQQQCLKEFVIYQKKTKDERIETIQGIPGKEKGFIHESISDYCDFADEPTEITKGSRKQKRTKKIFSDDWLKKYICKKRKSKKMIQKIKQTFKDNNSLNFDNWYETARNYFLTIKDVEKMKPDEKVDCLMLDRNVLDIAYELNKKNKPFRPEVFFRKNKITYTHKQNLEGNFFEKNSSYIIDKKTKKLKKINDDIIYDDWFQIEYKKEHWYPLINGYLPAKDSQGFSKLLGKKMHWTKFSKNTHIGWRGPFIKWSNLSKLPNIHYETDLE